jgi:hypothetical protein
LNGDGGETRRFHFYHKSLLPLDPQGLKEKVAEGRMREQQCYLISTLPPHPNPLPHGEGIIV